MKKRQNNSARASALQITLSVALLSISAILFASSFKAAPAAPAAPGRPQSETMAMSDTSDSTATNDTMAMIASLRAATAKQDGFYPPLPLVPLLPPLTTPTPSPITVSLPTDIFDNSVPIATVIIEPVTTTTLFSNDNLIGFQGDFTFDSAIVTFSSPYTNSAGLTATNWNVSANILNTGPAEWVWDAVQPQDAQGEQQRG